MSPLHRRMANLWQRVQTLVLDNRGGTSYRDRERAMPCAETLEDRQLLAGVAVNVSAPDLSTIPALQRNFEPIIVRTVDALDPTAAKAGAVVNAAPSPATVRTPVAKTKQTIPISNSKQPGTGKGSTNRSGQTNLPAGQNKSAGKSKRRPPAPKHDVAVAQPADVSAPSDSAPPNESAPPSDTTSPSPPSGGESTPSAPAAPLNSTSSGGSATSSPAGPASAELTGTHRSASAPGLQRKIPPDAPTDAELDSQFLDYFDREQLLFPDASPGADELLFPEGLPTPDEMPMPGTLPELVPDGSMQSRRDVPITVPAPPAKPVEVPAFLREHDEPSPMMAALASFLSLFAFPSNPWRQVRTTTRRWLGRH